MRIDSLWIGKYKNLKDIQIDFDEKNWITVILGWNGTGKSNVLEAIATLFRDLIMDSKRPSFRYKIIYYIRGKKVIIDADPSRERNAYKVYLQDNYQEYRKNLLDYEIENSDNLISYSKFKTKKDELLPKYIFGYYSGHSPRMEEVFRQYLMQYDKKLRNGEDPGLRQMFYALPIHSQFVLLAFLLQQDDSVKEFLDEQLGLDPNNGIDSILFVIKEPSWHKKSKDGVHDRFWGAKGIVRTFLDRLYDISLAPLRIKRKDDVSLWNKKTFEYIYLYIKDLKSLQDLVKEQAPREFFRDLESTYVSEMIEEVRIRVKLRKNDGSVIFKELSEGEQQLLTVLGLLKFTAEEESLFLLDEPDTHLNPQWSIKYLEYLQKFVGGSDMDQEKSHILLTTHNPIAIAELKKEQIQILTRDTDTLKISADMPDFDPRGLGFAGILTSEMFGLKASLDNYTLNLLEEKRKLSWKENLTEEDRKRLKEINAELDEYGFNYEVRDPDFKEFLKKKYSKK